MRDGSVVSDNSNESRRLADDARASLDNAEHTANLA
jgi:hypothetical protein